MNSSTEEVRVYCDFDGTAAVHDVGYRFFLEFALPTNGELSVPELVDEWKRGEISSRECLIRECRMVQATPVTVDAYADSHALDKHFPEFAHRCKAGGVHLEICSDGLKYYIRRILRNHGLDLDVQANHLTFLPPDHVEPQFPHFDHTCGRCANCKGHHVRQAREQGAYLVYIGDGLSDRCGAAEADMVFAKGDLARWCEDAGVAFRRFQNFEHVIRGMEEMGVL